MEIFYIDIENFANDDKLKNKHHYYGRYIVNYVAKEIYNIQNPELEIVRKKPRFKFSDINFSISHSKNIILAAFDKNPAGVDVEFMKDRNFTQLAKRYNLKITSKVQFYEFWTRYEAEIKLQSSPKKIITFPFMENYMLSLAGDFDGYKIRNLTENLSCI